MEAYHYFQLSVPSPRTLLKTEMPPHVTPRGGKMRIVFHFPTPLPTQLPQKGAHVESI